MRIFVFGDSHSYSGWEDIHIPNVEIHIRHLGAKLMHTFNKGKLIHLNDHLIYDGDTIVFCFGEIDARCHIHRLRESEIGFKNIINDLVHNYMAAIKEHTSEFNLKVCVYFVPPAVRKETILVHDVEYPFLGTDAERKKYVQYMNERLRNECEEKGFMFIDLYDQYCDKEGFLNIDMSDGGPHIKEIVPLVNFINRNMI